MHTRVYQICYIAAQSRTIVVGLQYRLSWPVIFSKPQSIFGIRLLGGNSARGLPRLSHSLLGSQSIFHNAGWLLCSLHLWRNAEQDGLVLKGLVGSILTLSEIGQPVLVYQCSLKLILTNHFRRYFPPDGYINWTFKLFDKYQLF